MPSLESMADRGMIPRILSACTAPCVPFSKYLALFLKILAIREALEYIDANKGPEFVDP
jgi:hypothetical protein